MGNNNSQIEQLEKVNPDQTDFFSFEGQILKAKVVDIYDGDTITVILEIHNGVYRKFKCRIAHIDSPEMKPLKTCENRDLHIDCAKKVKSILQDLIYNRVVELHCGKFDKYARVLVTIYYKNTNINDLLIKHKLVKVYEGKTKIEWSNQELEFINNFNVEHFKTEYNQLFQKG